MAKKRKKIIAVAMAAAMALCPLAGCTSSGDGKGTCTDLGNKTLFTYSKTDVSLKEAWIYAKMLGTNYESTYSSYYGDDFWNMSVGTDDEGESQTFGDYVKEQAVEQLKETIILCQKAEKYDCSLTYAEKQDCADYALSYYESTDGKEAMEECGATREDVEKIYQDAELASKVKEAVKEKAGVTVTDEEARKSTVYRIVFPTTETDSDGNVKTMGKKEKAKAKKKAKKILKKIQNGKMTIEEAAEKQGYENTDESYAAGGSEEGEAFEEKMKELEDGDLCGEVLECENGYVIAKLVAYTDEDETASNKETLTEEKETEAYEDTYDGWTKKLEKKWDYDEDVDQDLWSALKFGSEDSTAAESTEDASPTAEEGTTEADKEENVSTEEKTEESTETTEGAAESTTEGNSKETSKEG